MSQPFRKQTLFLNDKTKHQSNGDTHPVVEVHPVVLLTIIDHFTRRGDEHGRVIGTLIGRKSKGLIEITNCYPVPHTENSKRGHMVKVDVNTNSKFYDLHKQANKTEEIVGWYGTTYKNGDLITAQAFMIHDHYRDPFKDLENKKKRVYVTNPIHLAVDAFARDEKIWAKAFVASSVSLNDGKMAARFEEVRLKFKTSKAENIGIRALQIAAEESSEEKSTASSSSDFETLQKATEDLLAVLDNSCSYVDKVVDGTIKPDNMIGQKLAEAVGAIPRVDMSQLEKVFDSSVQDLLMVAYLSNLARSQVSIAEKLSKML
eukprot:g3432.t1